MMMSPTAQWGFTWYLLPVLLGRRAMTSHSGLSIPSILSLDRSVAMPSTETRGQVPGRRHGSLGRWDICLAHFFRMSSWKWANSKKGCTMRWSGKLLDSLDVPGSSLGSGQKRCAKVVCFCKGPQKGQCLPSCQSTSESGAVPDHPLGSTRQNSGGAALSR